MTHAGLGGLRSSSLLKETKLLYSNQPLCFCSVTHLSIPVCLGKYSTFGFPCSQLSSTSRHLQSRIQIHRRCRLMHRSCMSELSKVCHWYWVVEDTGFLMEIQWEWICCINMLEIKREKSKELYWSWTSWFWMMLHTNQTCRHDS